jgi:hypothetical protein
MRSSAIRRKGAASFEELKPVCQVLILHEDFSAYSRAVEVCRRVMERFASEIDFDIKCWNFIELAEPNCARHAAKSAGAADIVLISMRPAQLPLELARWLDFHFIDRFRSEGLLALVLSPAAAPAFDPQNLLARLDSVARRLEMDFISLLPGEEAVVIERLSPAPPRPETRG